MFLDKSFITWEYQTGDDVVTFRFDNDEMDVQEMFFKWVSFMNAIGYSLNRDEMFDMWHGIRDESDTEKELKYWKEKAQAGLGAE